MTLEERVAALAVAESGDAGRALFLALLDDPEQGDVFFINVCGMTYDPRKPTTVSGEALQGGRAKIIGSVPFLLWDAQERAARAFGHAMDNSYDLGGEKSRDVGFTWIVLHCLVKRWLREPGFSALIGHYVDSLLDSSDNSSLFWRIDFILKHLPPFLLPVGFDLDNKAWRSYGKLINTLNGNSITGAAPTERFGVGGRQTVVYFDDFARWEHGAAAYNSSASVTDCRVTTWTVNPDNPQNHAYDLRYGRGDFEGTKTKIVTVTWKDDPRKQLIAIDPATKQPYNVWLRNMIGDAGQGIPGRVTLETFKREYEMYYLTRAKGLIYAEQLPNMRVGLFPYDFRFPLYTTVDPGTGDTCVLLWLQWDWEQFRYRVVDCYHASGHGAKFYAPIILGRGDKNEALEHEGDYDDVALAAIARRTSWRRHNRSTGEWRVPYAGHFGDPASKNRSQSDGRSFHDILGDEGIDLVYNDAARTFPPRLEESRRVLRYTDVNEETCGYFADNIKDYRWNKLGLAPSHDEASHAASAFQYYCVNDPHKEEFLARSDADMAGSKAGAVRGAIFGDLATMEPAVRAEVLKIARRTGDLDGMGARMLAARGARRGFTTTYVPRHGRVSNNR